MEQNQAAVRRGKREAPAPTQPEKKEKQGWKQDLLDWLQLLVGVLVVIVAVFTFVMGIVGVVGSSMYPTLHEGDLMLVQRIAYTPRSGDVIVLRKDGAFDDRALVKRLIATGGQTVYIDYDANTVTVDGVTLDEPYINQENDDVMTIRSTMSEQYINQEFTVPEGCIFVMGDNRNGSSDSRMPELDMVDSGYIIGRVLLVIFPFAHIGPVA